MKKIIRFVILMSCVATFKLNAVADSETGERKVMELSG